MNTRFTTTALAIAGILIVLVAVAACQSESDTSNSTLEVMSGRNPNASVSGTVTYRERIALTEGVALVVELRTPAMPTVRLLLLHVRPSPAQVKSPSSSKSVTTARTSAPAIDIRSVQISLNPTIA